MEKNNIYVVRDPSRLQTFAHWGSIIYNQEVMTAISKENVEYLHKLLHKELDYQEIWSTQEENILDLVDMLYDYFFDDNT